MEHYKLQILDKYGVNLNTKASKKKFDPVLCRELEIRTILEVLCRKNKNNPILVGKPGVGKTAIIECIAGFLNDGNLPSILKDKVIYSIEISNLIADTTYRGEFEARLNDIILEIKNHGNIILFIDEIHNAIGTGSVKGGLDIANILKPSISRGEVHLIGATTDEEFEKFITTDKAFERRFQKIEVIEPDQDTAITMLIGSKASYESHHDLKISDQSIKTAVEISCRCISDKFLPDKALDLIDLACASLMLDLVSPPYLLITLDQKIAKLKMQISLINEDEQYKAAALSKELEELELNREQLQVQLSDEKKTLVKRKSLKRMIHSYEKEASSNKSIGYLSKHNEINDVLIPNLQQQLLDTTNRFSDEDPLVYKNELTPDDIIQTFKKYYKHDL